MASQEPPLTGPDIAALSRPHFPALNREIGGRKAVYLDGPAGSQVPRSVAEAVGDYLLSHNANHGGVFATSRESDALLDEAHTLVAKFLGSREIGLAAFGANMTSLTFALSRALASRWHPGDEILVTRMDHDANVSPWVRAAHDRGVDVQRIAIRPEDCTLYLDDFRRKLTPRTRLVAFCGASNAVGTRPPVAEMVAAAHAVGAIVFVDAVHLAPHARLRVDAWDCDFLACSGYKFFAPHVGILWGKRKHLETLPAYKLRPAPELLPDRWMTGTQNFEGIAGVAAALRYLERLGREVDPECADAFDAAFTAIETYERGLSAHFLDRLEANPKLKLYGIRDRSRLAERVPTFSFTHANHAPKAVAEHLAERGIFVWHGNYYALPLTEALGLEPLGMVRAGCLHYNTRGEIDRLFDALEELV